MRAWLNIYPCKYDIRDLNWCRIVGTRVESERECGACEAAVRGSLLGHGPNALEHWQELKCVIINAALPLSATETLPVLDQVALPSNRWRREPCRAHCRRPTRLTICEASLIKVFRDVSTKESVKESAYPPR